MSDEKHVNPAQALRDLPVKQDPKAAPVVLAPHLPSMEAPDAVKTVLRDTLLPLMGSGAASPTGGQGLMAAVPPQRPPASSPPPGKPQEPKPGARGQIAGEGYVRLEVHAENGRLSVTGAKQVAGPLAMPSAVIHGYAYEVLLNEQQVALGSLPDVGLRRAFANADVPDPQGKHFVVNVPTFDFAVRVPKGHFVTTNLPRLHIVLHDVTEAPDRLTTLAPLAKQPGVKTTEVGRLAGINLQELTPAVRAAIQQLLAETDKLR
jgi:hypothetical protein